MTASVLGGERATRSKYPASLMLYTLHKAAEFPGNLFYKKCTALAIITEADT